MNLCVRLSTIGLFVAFTCVALSGCEQTARGTIVKGKLVANGAPFTPPLPEIANSLPKPPPTVANPPDMTAMYRPRVTINSSQHSSQAIVGMDGSFELRGESGKGIPLGEYTVNITGAPIPAIDPFGGSLAGQTPFKITVPKEAGATLTLEPFDVGPHLAGAAAPSGAGS